MRRNFGTLLPGVLVFLGLSCSKPAGPPPSPSPQRYGDLMSEVGRRFERSGRAVLAGRWELAGYDLGELVEAFEDDLPHTAQPEDVKPDLRELMRAFTSTHPAELRKAVGARDRAAFETAFARAANTCNGCHQAAGRAFIEVPATPGREVPQMAAIASPPPAPGSHP